jgi:hypothetical protein
MVEITSQATTSPTYCTSTRVRPLQDQGHAGLWKILAIMLAELADTTSSTRHTQMGARVDEGCNFDRCGFRRNC